MKTLSIPLTVFLFILFTTAAVSASNPFFDVQDLGVEPGLGYGHGILPLFEFDGALYAGLPSLSDGVIIKKRVTDTEWVTVTPPGLNGNPGNFTVLGGTYFNGGFYFSVWTQKTSRSGCWDHDNNPGTPEECEMMWRLHSMDPFMIEPVDPPDGFDGLCVMGQTVFTHPVTGEEWIYVGITDGLPNPEIKVYRQRKPATYGETLGRYDWERVNTEEFSDSATDVSVLRVFDGELYAGLEDAAGAMVWKFHCEECGNSESGSWWEDVSTPGFDKLDPDDKNRNAFWLVEYGNRLYCQTWNGAGSEILRYDPHITSRTWTEVYKHTGDGGGLGIRNGELLTLDTKKGPYYYHPDTDYMEEIYVPPCLTKNQGIASITDFQGSVYITTSTFYANPIGTFLCFLAPDIACDIHGQIWKGLEVAEYEIPNPRPACCGMIATTPMSYPLAFIPVIGFVLFLKRRLS